MAKKKSGLRPSDEPAELLKDLLIVQLCLAGVKQSDVRVLARCDANRVSRIAGVISAAQLRAGD